MKKQANRFPFPGRWGGLRFPADAAHHRAVEETAAAAAAAQSAARVAVGPRPQNPRALGPRKDTSVEEQGRRQEEEQQKQPHQQKQHRDSS